jgi:Peptidase M50B-like
MLFGIVEQYFKEDKPALRLRQGGAPIVSTPASRSGAARDRAPRPAEARALAAIRAELGRLIRYDDESIVLDIWAKRRYDSGRYRTLGDARRATVTTAWHEAGHAVAALAVGARFNSASIHPGRDTEGRVHGIQGSGDLAFVVDAAGQIAERLMAWTLLDDDGLRAWLPTWRGDGGDARRFRASIRPRFGGDEFAAWRYSESLLTPLRPKIRHVARALLVHPRHIPQPVVAAVAADC